MSFPSPSRWLCISHTLPEGDQRNLHCTMRDQEGSAAVCYMPACFEPGPASPAERRGTYKQKQRQASYTERWASSKKGSEFPQQSQAQPWQFAFTARTWWKVRKPENKSAQVGGIPGATGCNVNIHTSLKHWETYAAILTQWVMHFILYGEVTTIKIKTITYHPIYFCGV